MSTAHAAEPKRIALVVGNSAYTKAPALANPARDADAFSAFLTKSGFETIVVKDADRTSFSRALSEFSRKIGPSDTALFFFAGHGMQLRGENFLLGTDAQLTSEFDVAAETVALNDIIRLMERSAKVSMIFLDACRDNPLANRLAEATRSGATRGLARVEPSGTGTLIAFAAGPGQVAYDGSQENSPFTAALVSHLATPGLEVGTAFKRVIGEVRQVTQDRQSPQIVSNLAAEVYFGPGGNEALSQASLELIDYEKAERINTPRAWELLLQKYPKGSYTQMAALALEKLQGSVARSGATPLTPVEAEAALKLTAAQRKDIKSTLQGLGYKPSGGDALDSLTRREIARYQKAVGMSETGYVSPAVLANLNVPIAMGAPRSGAMVSADEARAYSVDDLKGLETDPRLLKAVACLSGSEIIYGFFQGHLYVAVLDFNTAWEEANQKAIRCGGHLVTITSAEENAFVFKLFAEDDRFFSYYTDGIWKGKQGPLIGLRQQKGSREPAGGWGWSTGEKINYNRWSPGQPNNNRIQHDYGRFHENSDKVSHDKLVGDYWDDTGNRSGYGYIIEFE